MNELPLISCPKCGGDGYTAEHNPMSYDEDGAHDCSSCPIQVQCDHCQATGKVVEEIDDTKGDENVG